MERPDGRRIKEGRHVANQIIHVEVVGKDAPRLQKYFGDLFGWSIDTNNPGGYGMFNREETGIAGGVGPAPEGTSGHVTFYVAVPDVDAALARAEQLGGKIVMPKFEAGPNAILGLFADPEGHVIGLTEL